MVGTGRLDSRAIEQIKSGAISQKGVTGVADSLHITARHLRRIVKAKTGSSPIQLDRKRRLSNAKTLLRTTKLSIVAVAFSCDFASLRQFNDAFKKTFNMTPRQMRNNYKTDTKKDNH